MPTAFSPLKTPERDPVIHLEEVAVSYRIPKERIPSLKEYAIRRLKRSLDYSDFWALQGITLEVFRGEVLGVIGANGAGKSTLLKVIARVLRPNRGRVRINGRVSPLLELGAGFDFELTGLENIFLNGMILGYPRQQLAERLEWIAEFADLREFIHSPLRTYSSGMLARLGFAVATEFQPEILIVDEILAVGDADFQRKSSDRIKGFQALGTTILLVSHNLDAVQEMCTRAVWLDRGRIKAQGSAEAVVKSYLGYSKTVESERLKDSRGLTPSQRSGSRLVEIKKVRLMDGQGQERNIYETGEILDIHLDYETRGKVPAPIFGIGIHRQDGIHVCGPNTGFSGFTLPVIEGPGTVRYRIPFLPLLEGLFHVSVAVVSKDYTETYDYHDQAYPFRVINERGRVLERYGLMTLGGEWSHSQDNANRFD